MASARAYERRTVLAGRCLPGSGQWVTGTSRCLLLAPAPASTKSARDFTAAVLRGWGLDELVQDAVLIASELTANAIRYGAPQRPRSGGAGRGAAPVELSWHREAGQITCVVTDASSDPPVLAPTDLGAESGRGLQIVDALAADWGWALLSAQRKAVWAALPLPAAG